MTIIAAHIDYLKARGIDAKAAEKRGIVSAQSKKPAISALRIPYYSADGKVLLNDHKPFSRDRLFYSKAGFAALGRPPKFKQPPGTRNHLFLDSVRKDWGEIFCDPNQTIYIVEGEFKAMCATEHGLVCVAIGGVWNWKDKHGPIRELDLIIWRGRMVVIVFDADAATNPNVEIARAALAMELRRRGAEVKTVNLPPAADDPKQGLDDFLVANGRKAFDALPREDVSLVLSAADPHGAAKTFADIRHNVDEVLTLRHWRGDFLSWDGAHYVVQEAGAIRQTAYDFLAEARERAASGLLVAYKPTKSRVDNMLDALRAVAHHDASRAAPCWLDGRAEPDPRALVTCANGILSIGTGELHPHDPALFSTHAVPFAYDPAATAVQWEDYLRDRWPGQSDQIATLQEVFGLLLTQDTSYQKIFLIVGPKRSGKGTIARMLEQLVGCDHVCAPTLAHLATQFGPSSLVGKQLAVIGDARLSGRTDATVVTERLLSISGEDSQTVDRKHREPITVRLGTRFLLISNELPRFLDASGALVSRFVVLRMEQSFYGKEDPAVEHALYAELPGIFNWALAGLKRLRKRGYFEMPKASRELVCELEDLSSPVGAFLRDKCDVGPGKVVDKQQLYKSWVWWCDEHGKTWTGDAAWFGRDLRAALPALGNARLRIGGQQTHCFTGVALRQNDGKVPKRAKF